MNRLKAICFLIALTMLLKLAGCSINESKESLRINDDGLYYESKVSQGLFAYFTQTKQIEHVTPLSSTVVGEINSEPDPNSIDALDGLIGGAVKAVILK